MTGQPVVYILPVAMQTAAVLYSIIQCFPLFTSGTKYMYVFRAGVCIPIHLSKCLQVNFLSLPPVSYVHPGKTSHFDSSLLTSAKPYLP